MAPAVDINGGSNFSMSSVLMQSRAGSNRTQWLSTKYEAIVSAGYRSMRSIRSITVFFADLGLIPRMGAKSWDWCGASWNAALLAQDASRAVGDAQGLIGFRGAEPGMDGVNPRMRAVMLGRTPSGLGCSGCSRGGTRRNPS